MGLKTHAGKAAADESLISDLKLKAGQKLMMLGASEEVIAKTNLKSGEGDDDAIVDDFQMEEGLFEELEPHKDPDVLVRVSWH